MSETRYDTSRTRLGDEFKSVGFPNLQKIRSAIPKHCFAKSLSRSLLYFIRDFCLVAGSMFAMTQIVRSQWWVSTVSSHKNSSDKIEFNAALGLFQTLSFALKISLIGVYWLATGLFMWCLVSSKVRIQNLALQVKNFSKRVTIYLSNQYDFCLSSIFTIVCCRSRLWSLNIFAQFHNK